MCNLHMLSDTRYIVYQSIDAAIHLPGNGNKVTTSFVTMKHDTWDWMEGTCPSLKPVGRQPSPRTVTQASDPLLDHHSTGLSL
ncbi:hypothetical protein J6590_017146 [Homalodisca vitripennis]|nr:hypothetical protein J6590_017146 [Homalodisca vitripennis]